MTATLTRDARYARIAQVWLELREDCPDCEGQGEYWSNSMVDWLSCGDCGGKGWMAKTEPWSLLVAAAVRGKSYGLWQDVVGAILCHATETPTSEFCEDALLSAVERLLELEEWC